MGAAEGRTVHNPKMQPYQRTKKLTSSFFVRLLCACRSFGLNRQAEKLEKHAVLRQSLDVAVETA